MPPYRSALILTTTRLPSEGAPVSTFTDKLNDQLAHEFGASQQYVAIAVWYDQETLPLLARHFYRQAVEERNHAMIIVQYLLDAQAPVSIPAVAGPRNEFSDPIEPVRMALDQEKTVTGQIQELARVARAEGDLVGEQFLAWFLKGQLEEMSSMADLLRTVERAAETNILLAEAYLARTQVGDEGKNDNAPPAAGAL
jgi:ferritin